MYQYYKITNDKISSKWDNSVCNGGKKSRGIVSLAQNDTRKDVNVTSFAVNCNMGVQEFGALRKRSAKSSPLISVSSRM